MTIYGVSQSSGVEKRLRVERGGQGIVLTFIDHTSDKERGRIMSQGDALMAAVTNPSAGGTVVEGIEPPHGPTMRLHIEVRRNEVQLCARGGSGAEPDAAVGLDDFMDALEKAIGRGE